MTTDRHRTPGYLYRPAPADLLKQLDEKVGKRPRSKVISLLLGRFVAGQPMPTPAEVIEEVDKSGQGHGA